ncbi:MAG: P1 family peptidase [Oscillospiraceae bacterium]|jgi:L-aminopeptidase/D-esterase-like protein|nr:P1 family peptidase [Oscillospiraceae bacterium]
MDAVNIRDIPGFRIGQAQDFDAATGCTVIISEAGAVCGADVRGGSPGTRDTDALNPVMNRKRVHAVLLAGGSSFGLDAAGGVMRFLEARRVGRDVGVTVTPNVCAAILFDLKCGRADIRPDAEMGLAACRAAFAGQEFQSGSYGAGTGATIGKSLGLELAMKGGVGAAAFRFGELLVGAVVAVNCVGDVLENGRILAGTRRAGEKIAFAGSERVLLEEYRRHKDFFSENTVLGCVVSNARLDKAGATKLAQCGQNGIARAVRPAHSTYDGDTVFALCSGEAETTLDAACILGAAAVEAAILDAVRSARGLGGYPSLSELRGAAAD